MHLERFVLRGLPAAALAALLSWPAPAPASASESSPASEEAQAASRLAAEASDFLEQMLGPGRAKVLVTVEGERTEVRTQTEVLTPIRRPKGAKARPLPGYEEGEDAGGYDYVQKDQEQSLRHGGLVVKQIRVSVVLDTGLTDAQVAAARSILQDLLRMDPVRGDTIAILRAPLVPMWKRAFMSFEGMRTLSAFGFILGWSLLVCALAGGLAYVMLMRAVRTLVSGVAASRGWAGAAAPAAPLAPAGVAPGAVLPGELLPDGLPSLAGGPAASPEGEAPALGRRFDFLASRGSGEAAELLAREAPDDLALLFASLADSDPDLSARLFLSLPAALQAAVSERMAKLTESDPERLAAIEGRLRTAADLWVRGPDRLGRILSRLPSQDREGILSDLVARDAASAEKVEGALFPFESVAELDLAGLRRLITAVPYQDWGAALRGVAAEVADRVLGQLPGGIRGLVVEAMAAPQPLEKVLEARSRILSQASSLASRGLISLKRPGSSREVI